jgi:hypothetical protein
MHLQFMKIKTAIACALLLGALAPATRAADPSAPPAILIYTTVGYPPPGVTNLGPRLVVALWDDGKIIWSDARVAGGPPYFQGQCDRKKLDALLGALESRGALTNTALERAWFGPDSSTTRMIINHGPHRLALESWHELFEQHSNLVATAQAVTPLNGRNRDEVLREQPPNYRQFRNTWSEVRDRVAELIPAKGDPCNDRLPVMNW